MRRIRKRVMALALVLACSFTPVSPAAAEASGDSGIRGSVPRYSIADTYRDYLESHASAGSGEGTVVLRGADYEAADGMEVELRGDSVLTGTRGSISWNVDAAAAGMYQIDVEYKAELDGGNDIQMNLLLNGEVPFAQASPVVFCRIYQDQNKNYKTMKGNQAFPPQVEVDSWRTVPISDGEGYYGDGNGLKFYLEKGSNRLTLQAVKDRLEIRSITVRPAEELQDYASWLAAMKGAGVPVIGDAACRVQGEDAVLKSKPSFYPRNDRTSPLSEPYDPTYIVLNTIGGSGWKQAGDWLEWEFDVPESGLYRIASRYKQKDSVGFAAVRAVSVNGRVPYAEAEDVRFDYTSSFKTGYLRSASGEDLYFYLEKGANRVRLTCGPGGYADAAIELQDVIEEISSIYYSITAITGTSPTKYQDYQLTQRIPGLEDQLRHAGGRLKGVRDMVVAVTAGTTDASASIDRSAEMFLDIADHPSRITDKVTYMADYITALGSAVLTLSQQSLTIDWLELQGADSRLPKAEGNILQVLKHEVLSFIGSFTNDYNVAMEDGPSKSDKPITVWISTGRDQMDVLRRLINESFASQSGVAVDLKLVDAGTIMTAVAGGTGPDVAIGLSNTLPMELGYRDAAYDLAQFPDFGEVASQFSPAAVDTYAFDGKYYGLPDQMSFPVLFYRKDILAKYDVMVPDTWEDLISIIPTLATYNMQAYLDKDSLQTLGAGSGVGTSTALNSVYLSMLYQRGANLYNEKGTESLLLEDASVDSFETWTDFYTKYGFSPSVSFVTRFRLGNVPLAIMDISYFNTLSISAPEISGKWGVSLVPGTRGADGSVDHSVPVTTSSVAMIKSSVERNHSEAASWEFIKWWVSAGTQTSYAREMEAVLGSSGRYMVSNLQSFGQTSWPAEVYTVLEESLAWLREVRQVPGSYLAGRNLSNAFYAILDDRSLDLLDTLAGEVESLDAEIAKKRKEYGLEME